MKYNVNNHGVISAIHIWMSENKSFAELAFAYGGTEVINWAKKDVEPYLPGISAYTVFFDARDRSRLCSHVNKTVRLFLRNGYQPMMEINSACGVRFTLHADHREQWEHYFMSFIPNTYIEDARFAERSFTDYVYSGKRYMTETIDDWTKTSEGTYTLQKIREKRSNVKARHKNHRNAYFKYAKNPKFKTTPTAKSKYGSHSNSRNALSARERREMDSAFSHLSTYNAPHDSGSNQVRDDHSEDWEMFQSVRDEIVSTFALTPDEADSLSCTDVLYLAGEMNMGGNWAKKPEVPYQVHRIHGSYDYGFGYEPYRTYSEPELGAVARNILRNRGAYDSLLNMNESSYDFWDL